MIQEWTEFIGAWWISDDQEAVRYAGFQGITTYETIDLVKMAVADGDVGAKAAFDLMNRMADNGRSLRLPSSVSDLTRWEDWDLVFCQPNGRPIDPRADWAEWGAAPMFTRSGCTMAGTPPARCSSNRASTSTRSSASSVTRMRGPPRHTRTSETR